MMDTNNHHDNRKDIICIFVFLDLLFIYFTNKNNNREWFNSHL